MTTEQSKALRVLGYVLYIPRPVGKRSSRRHGK